MSMTWSDWHAAHDALPREKDLETIDQKLAYAQVLATLAVAQEINHFSVGESGLGESLAKAAEAFSTASESKDGSGGAW